MIIFPAVDIRGGRAVRLARGNPEEETLYGEDPLAIAQKWENDGASWLHIIDLDGAFSGSAVNRTTIARIAEASNIKIQIGGGIRSMGMAEAYLEAGATRLIFGTVALEDPALFAKMCREFPGRIGVSLDGKDGRLKSRGWVKDASLTLSEAVPRLEDAGASFIIYTDIERDGMQTGVNLPALANLLSMTWLPVIAAGGVSTLKDIADIYALATKGNLEGAISGRAIYEGSLNLKEAIEWLESNTQA